MLQCPVCGAVLDEFGEWESDSTQRFPNVTLEPSPIPCPECRAKQNAD